MTVITSYRVVSQYKAKREHATCVVYNPTVTGEIVKSTNLLKVISNNAYRVMGIESV